MIDLSIIVVSYNVRDLLRDCLDSVAAGPIDLVGRQVPKVMSLQTEVIVVDCASSDGTVRMINADFPWARVIEVGQNVGFSKGNNWGLEASSGRYLLLLNPDTRVIGSALTTMVEYMEQHPGAGAVGPQLLNEDRSVQSSRRRFPTLWTAFFESTWLQPVAPRSVLRSYYMLDFPDQQCLQVDWVTGAAILVRREVVRQVGDLDEGFFMYSEELDWQRRIKKAGWDVVYLPDAQIIHYGGKSSEQEPAQRHIRYQTSKIRYFRKYHGTVSAQILRLFLLASYAMELGIEATKALAGHRRGLRAERVKAYWHVLRSGLRGS